MTIVNVIWNDAASIDEWTHIDEVDSELCEIHSCGMLVKENSEVLTIAVNHDVTENNYSCIMNIPKKWILKRVDIPA